MKKLLIVLVSILLLACIVVSAVNLVPTLQMIDWGDVKEHFQKDEERFTLSVQTSEGGSVNSTEPDYPKGSMINLSATPDEGYIFAGWYTAEDTYLTTAKAYSFAIEADTVLKAEFVPQPQDMDALYESYQELFNCSQNFSFSVFCDRADAAEYLANNLAINDVALLGTEYEEFGAIDFTVEQVGDTNEFRIVVTDTYQPGTTYTATLPAPATEEEAPEANFIAEENTSESLNFTIEKENCEVMEFQNGIFFLVDSEDPALDQVLEVVDDGKTEEEEGDLEDYIIISVAGTLKVGDIICVFDGTYADGQPNIDEDAFFAKVLRIEAQTDGSYKVVYGMPNLEEIFTELDVYQEEDLDLEANGVEISDEVIEEIRYALMSDESFQEYIAAAQQAMKNQIDDDEYEVELLSSQNLADKLKISVRPTISGNKVTVKIDITLTQEIKKKNTNTVVAKVGVKITVERNMEFRTQASLSIRRFWGIPIGLSYLDCNVNYIEKENLNVKFFFTMEKKFYDKDLFSKNTTDEALEKEFEKLMKSGKADFQQAKDVFKQAGYTPSSKKSVKLFGLSIPISCFTVGIDVNFAVTFELSGSLSVATTNTKNLTVGLRSWGGIPTPYHSITNDFKVNDLTVAGKVGIKVGIEMEAYFGVNGLAKYVKAGVKCEVGAYAEAAGLGSVALKKCAVYIEAGFYFEASIFYKLFFLGDEWEIVSWRHPLLTLGYTEALVNYKNQTNLQKGTEVISFTGSDLSLFDLSLLKVQKMNVPDGKVTEGKIDIKAAGYTVEVKVADGKWLEYKDGLLTVKQGAPLYFEDSITITVTPKYKTFTHYSKDKCAVYLPEITLKVEYGNEDAYYDALDDEMQKEFRTLFRNYQEKNIQVLRNNFNNLIDNVVTVPARYSEIFDQIVTTYIDHLFATIKTYRAQEKEGDRTMENRFVAQEANVFRDTVDLMNRLMDEKSVYEDEILALLEEALESTALYDTMIEVSKSDKCQVLSDRFQVVPEDTQAIVRDAINKFDADHAGDARAKALADAFRGVFGFGE